MIRRIASATCTSRTAFLFTVALSGGYGNMQSSSAPVYLVPTTSGTRAAYDRETAHRCIRGKQVCSLTRTTAEPSIRVLPLHDSINCPSDRKRIQLQSSRIKQQRRFGHLCLVSGSMAIWSVLKDWSVQNMSHGWLASWPM
jgi:hypothetical protein